MKLKSDEILKTILTFTIENQTFGLDINDVRRVSKVLLKELYLIPKSSEEVLGLHLEDDEVFPVFDLPKLLNQFDYNFHAIDTKEISIIKIKSKGFTSGIAVQEEVER